MNKVGGIVGIEGGGECFCLPILKVLPPQAYAPTPMKTSLCRGCPRHFRQRSRGRQIYCKKCRLKRATKERKLRAKRRKQRYYRRLRASLCPECGGPRDLEGFHCLKCRARNNESRERTVTTERATQYQNTYLKKNRKEGLCPKCGGPRDDEHIHCKKCRDRAMNYYHNNPEAWIKRKLNATPPPPKPVCQTCHLQHLRCDRCGKYMHVEHNNSACSWNCKCGIIQVIPQFSLMREIAKLIEEANEDILVMPQGPARRQ